jgi:cytochrome c biogenesis protein CcmG/thiol:disulfide interchange protein DsbE
MNMPLRSAILFGMLFPPLLGGASLAAEAAAVNNGGSSQAAAVVAAPGFSEKDIFERSTIDLKQFRGKVVILNFWATWCPPCREEIPALEAIQNAHRKDVEVIGVSVFCSSASTELFYAEYKINYPMIYGSYEMLDAYGRVRTIPTTFLITRKGDIAQRVTGSRTKDEYEAMLKPLLAP